MIWTNLDFLAVVAYGLVFFGLIFRAEMFQWFWASVILWLGVSILGSQLLPGMWGITHVGPLFVPHFYLTFASVFFFAFHWKKQADTDFWQADLQHPFLSVFAVSNVLMTLAFVSIAAILYFLMPGRSLAFTFPALLKLYALKPVYWFVLQLVMMAVFYLHRRSIAKQSPAVFSKAQLRLGWLMALVMQTLVTGAIVGEIGLH